MYAALLQKSAYCALQMSLLCSTYTYQESITGSAFTLTFHFYINSDRVGAQSLLSMNVGEETAACELLPGAWLSLTGLVIATTWPSFRRILISDAISSENLPIILIMLLHTYFNASIICAPLQLTYTKLVASAIWPSLFRPYLSSPLHVEVTPLHVDDEGQQELMSSMQCTRQNFVDT